MPHPASPILPDSPHVLESIVEEGHDCVPHSGPRNQSSGACQSSPFGESVSPSVSSPRASWGNDYEYVETSAGKTARSSQVWLEIALEVLRFVCRSDGAIGRPAIEKLFDELSSGGLLHRSKFGQCIGMKELESSSKLFNALARRHIIYTDSIDKTELLKFWDEISDDRFDSRLQIFFDMMNKSTDGRITEEQVEEIIMLSFSEKKYPEIHRNAEEYAMLIKTELDPDNLGYIQIDNLQTLMLEPIQHVSTSVLGPPASKQFLPSDHAVIRDASSWIKQVSQELRRLGFMRDARTSAGESIDQSKSAAAQALKALKSVITTNNAIRWPTVENHFYELSSNGLLHRSKFGDCIGMKELEYAGDLFDALTRRHNICTDFINKAELLEFWDQISDKRFDSRMQIFFDMMDKSADGRITGEEVKEIIIISSLVNEMSEIQKNSEEYAEGDEMSQIQKNPEVYTRLIMEELDPNNLGYIEPYNLQMKMMQVRSQPVGINTANKGSLGETNQSLPQTVELNTLRRWYRVQYLLQDNWKRVWVMLLWLCICSGLFAWKFSQYRRRTMFHVMGYCICVAKGSAETLKFNMALVLLPVCRKTITRIHDRTKIGRVVPLDDNINFHKVISVGIILGAGLHIISHLICGYPRLLPATDAEYEPTKLFFREKRPPNYRWLVMDTEGWTGLLMLVLIAVAFTLATSRFRHGRLRLPGLLKRFVGFNAFWYSHHLFVVVYALLVVHGQCLYLTHNWYKKTTWIYLSIPMFLYTCERFTGVLLSSVQRVRILKISRYPGNMVSLRFNRPPGFRYKSGQFIFVNCSAASSFEWRPFYITSAPQDDYISIHIRILGGWAAKIDDVFSTIWRSPQDDDRGHVGRFPKLLIDGPYGTVEQDYKRYDVVLVVGIGDRAAPMISIIKDISNNIKQLDDHVDDIESGAVGDGATSFRTRRAYFYWVTWEQGSSDWSRSVIQEVLEADNRDAIELHHHYATGDARSALIAMLQAFKHCKLDDVQRQGDGITYIKTQCTLPRWRAVYKRIALNHVYQRVGVFYSGTPMLEKKLRQLARDFSRKTRTKFVFHTVDTSIS